MKPPVLAFSTIGESDGFHTLREPWNALWADLDNPKLFSSFDWCWNAWRLIAERRGCELRLVCGWLDGHLVLIWPMMVDSGVLRMLSSETFEYRDIIVKPSGHASRWVEDAWSYVLATTQASTFLFQNLRQTSALGAKLATMSGAQPIGGGWSSLIRLDRFAGWDAYASTLPKSLASDQRSQWKRVRQVMPEMSFRLVDSADLVEPVIDWIGLHKTAWGEARGKRGWFNAEDLPVMLKSIANSARHDGRVVLATLSDRDTTMSAGWGYVCGSEFLFYAFAYDSAYATYSPSRLFLEGLLQYCFRNGIRTFDFLPGDEPYKRIWATDYAQQQSYVGALNWRGELLLWLSRTRIISEVPDVLLAMYRTLPVRWRRAVQSRMRAFRLIHHALNRKLTAKPPAVPLLPALAAALKSNANVPNESPRAP